MENDFIPYGRHQILEEDIESVVKTLRSEFITQGKIVPEFENNICKKVSSKYAVAVNSATSALHLACLALGVTKDDIVWTTPISFVASANCALYCGAIIDFVDVNPLSGLMDIESLKIKLEMAAKNNKLPKVLIPVHLAGTSCDMEEIYKLSNLYGFSIIEDASHAIGGSYKYSPVGSCSYSDITVFSFHPVKIITSGEGGVATTNNSRLAENIKILRSHGIVKDQNKFQFERSGSWYYEQQKLGFNYRITDIQASLGLSQLNRLEKIVSERNKQLSFYKDIFKALPVSFLDIPEDVHSSVHLAVLIISEEIKKKYSSIFEGMRNHNIGVQLHYNPIYKNPFYRKYAFNENNFPGSENYASRAISIPLYPGLSVDQQIRVRKVFEKLLK